MIKLNFADAQFTSLSQRPDLAVSAHFDGPNSRRFLGKPQSDFLYDYLFRLVNSAKCEMIKNYYEILGIQNDASYDDVKGSWREKAKQWHPDKFLSAEEKLKAHEQFVDILEAYSVLIDEHRRAQYDSGMADAQSDRQYTGYENASPVDDQKEAADWFQLVMAETPWEFTKATFIVLLIVPTFWIIWLGVAAMIVVLFDFVAGKSQLGLGGAIIVSFMLLTNMVFSILGIFFMKDLYYRAKRVAMWTILRARGRRIFSRALIKTNA